MSDELETWKTKVFKLDERIEALEKKLDVWIEGQKKYNRATGETIAELKEKLDSPNQTEKKEPTLQDYFLKQKYHNIEELNKTIKDSGGDDKCEECGGYRMGENMMHNDWCSQRTTTTTGEKLPEPNCDDCKYSYVNTKKYCGDVVGVCINKNKFEPKEKAEPEKELYFCENCGNEISEVEGIVQITQEERVRGATRKELIEKFQTDLDSLNPYIPYQYEPLNEIKKKWRRVLK